MFIWYHYRCFWYIASISYDYPSQVVRVSKMQKTDVWSRKLPLQTVIPLAEQLRKILLFHREPIYADVERLYCICHGKSNSHMLGCEGCNEWYHGGCMALKGPAFDKAASDKMWRCGFCLGAPDEDGNVVWCSGISEAQKKSKRAKIVRHVDNTPLRRGIALDASQFLPQRIPTRAEIAEEIRIGGEKKREEELAKRGKAARAVKRGGHHQVDMRGNGGVVPRKVNGRLVDELAEAGMLSEGEGGSYSENDVSDDE